MSEPSNPNANEPLCELCGQRPAEFEIRKVSDSPKPPFHRALCKSCLATALADDTASIVKITKSSEPEPNPPGGVN